MPLTQGNMFTERLHWQAHNGLYAKYGKVHQHALLALNNLVDNLYAKGSLQKAPPPPLMREAVEEGEGAFGTDSQHPVLPQYLYHQIIEKIGQSRETGYVR